MVFFFQIEVATKIENISEIGVNIFMLWQTLGKKDLNIFFFLQHLHPHSKKFKHEKDISPTQQEDFIFCNIFKILSCFLKFCEITSKYNPTIAIPFCFMVGLLFLLFVGEKFPVKLTQQWKFNENIIFFYGVKWRQKKQTRTKSSNLKLWLQSPVLHTARTYVSPCMR